MPRTVAVTVHATARVPPERVFEGIVPIDLTRMMQGMGPLPAVTGVRDQTGPWDVPGSARIVELSDGTSAPERILAVSRPGAFHYRVGPFGGAFGRIVEYADGSFLFDEESGGTTTISWTYAFRPRRGATVAVRAVAPLWRRYASQSLARAVRIAEG